MNHILVVSRLAQRTCLALNYNVDVNTIAAVCRHPYKQPRDLVRNSCSMTTPITTVVRRFYAKYVGTQSTPRARLGTSPPLSEERAYELIAALKESERIALKLALEKHQALKLKEGFEAWQKSETLKLVKQKQCKSETKKKHILLRLHKEVFRLCQLAALRWRTRFGRISNVSSMSQVNPTGDFCTLDEWLKKKAGEKALPPTSADLYKIFFTNAVPFVAFGFLDNFIMIVAGDSIENFMGSIICISTMAAAGLGNTISDVFGIGTAFYVERICSFLGLRPPDLSPAQLEMKICQRVANYGRVIGITIGCLLGMSPLLFFNLKGNGDKSLTSES